MSASLVGSEMCIRDRSWRASGSSGEKHARAAFTMPSSTSGALCAGTTSCLLYTSDAADDM
eukprot:14519785-Alexandrium_andersonii.AAC.1